MCCVRVREVWEVWGVGKRTAACHAVGNVVSGGLYETGYLFVGQGSTRRVGLA